MSKPAILCVDDRIVVLESLEIEFQKTFPNNNLYGCAESADEALEIIDQLSQNDPDIVVIVSDWLMPGIKGDKFLIAVNRKYPKIITIILTGQADLEAIERAKTQANLHACINLGITNN